MTKAMPFLQKVILLSYDPRPFGRVFFMGALLRERRLKIEKVILMFSNPLVI